MAKKYLVIQQQLPFAADNTAPQALDFILGLTVISENIDVLFMQNAIYQLNSHQYIAENFYTQDFTKTIAALPLYGVNNIFVQHNAELLNAIKISSELYKIIKIIKINQTHKLINTADLVFYF